MSERKSYSIEGISENGITTGAGQFTEKEVAAMIKKGYSVKEIVETTTDPRVCRCKDCEDERAAIEAQRNHPFYKRVDEFRDEIKEETMIKAAKKYKEPFNPLSWSIQELGKHAMAENYDQGNYIMGLVEKAEELQRELDKYKDRCKDYEVRLNNQEKIIKFYKTESEYWRLRLIKEVGPDAAKRTKGGIIDKQI